MKVWKTHTRLFAFTLVGGALLLPLGVYPRVMRAQELDEAHQKIAQALPAVSVVSPKLAPDARTITLPGTVDAVVQTPIYARASGYVKQRFVDIGDRVKAGQLLATIESPELDKSVDEAEAQVLGAVASLSQMEANVETARAQMERAQADLSQSKATLIQRRSEQHLAGTTYQRYKVLVEEGAVSYQDGDERQTAVHTTEAAVQAAEQQVRALGSEYIAARAKLKAEQATLAVAQQQIDAAKARAARSGVAKAFDKVVAPFDGVITERTIDEGSLVTEGSENSKQPMFSIARFDTVKILVDVPQFASSRIAVGQKVAVSVKEYPGTKFEGTVVRTSVALDPTARTMRTELHVPNQSGQLAPGMYAEAALDVPRNGNVFLIPSNAVVIRDTVGPQVVTVSGGTTTYRSVTLGDDLGADLEVVRGLTSADKVVVNPQDSLRNGDKVLAKAN